VLVLKRNTDILEGATWGLVGGKIEDGEIPKLAAIRECKEEIGVQVSENELEPLATYLWDRDTYELKFELFRCRKENLVIQLDERENTEYRWEKPQDLVSEENLMLGLYPILKDTYALNQ
jgi:8-oxo-dGTP diphosphatase